VEVRGHRDAERDLPAGAEHDVGTPVRDVEGHRGRDLPVDPAVGVGVRGLRHGALDHARRDVDGEHPVRSELSQRREGGHPVPVATSTTRTGGDVRCRPATSRSAITTWCGSWS
jgi:hypothetical protein